MRTIENKNLPEVSIGLVAKYLDQEDTYMSVVEAIKSAAWHNRLQANIIWIDSERPTARSLKNIDGILVPGGFGTRGLEGKIKAAEFAMKHKKPYLGLCLGLQMAVVALARQVIDPTASSTELDPKTNYPVISLMEEQNSVTDLGGTMRLGDYVCELDPHSLSRKQYKSKRILERHRHRYEFNNLYRAKLEQAGMRMAGVWPEGNLVEIIEMKNHPFFVATQFHPEFKSRPERPHPLFDGFIKAVKKQK